MPVSLSTSKKAHDVLINTYFNIQVYIILANFTSFCQIHQYNQFQMQKQPQTVQQEVHQLYHLEQQCNIHQPANVHRTFHRNSNHQNKSGHWNQKQNAKYCAFIDKFQDKFSFKQTRRQWKVFKAMSNFIKTRNANQCRSHHHKMTKNFQTIMEALEYLRAKNGQLEYISKKYYQKLQKVDFNMLQSGKISQLQINNNNKKPINKQQPQNIIKSEFNQFFNQKIDKKNDISKLGTAPTYEQNQPQYEYEQNHNYQFFQNSGSLPTTGLLENANFYYPTYDFQDKYKINMPRSREQILLQCQDLFVRWVSKVNQLVQIDSWE